MKLYNFKGLLEKVILLLFCLILVLFPVSPILADEARESPRPGLDKADEDDHVRPGWGNEGNSSWSPDRQLDWDEIKMGGDVPGIESGNGSGIGGGDVPSMEGGDGPGLGNGYPGFGSDYPVLNNGYPGFGSGYPWIGNGYPGFGSDYPWIGNGYPGFGSDYPWLSNGYPGYGSGYPWLSNGYPGYGSGYPWLSNGYPGYGSGYPGLVNGYPGYVPGFVGDIIGRGFDSLATGYYGKSGSDEGGIPSQITSTVSSATSDFIDIASYVEVDQLNMESGMRFGKSAVSLPLSAASPWLGSNFQMTLDSIDLVSDGVFTGLEWSKRISDSSDIARSAGLLANMKNTAQGLWDSTKGIKGAWDTASKFTKGTGILGSISAIGNTIESIHHFRSGNALDGWGSGIGALGDTLAAVSLFTGPAAPFVAGAGLLLMGVSAGIRYREKLDQAWNATKNFASNVWNGTKDIASNVWNGTKDIASNVWNGTKDIASNVWNGTKDITSNVWNGTKDVASNVWNGTKDVASNVWNGTKDVASNVWIGTKDVASNVWNGTKDIASNVWNGTKDVASNVWDGTKDIANNTWDSTKDIAGKAWNATTDAVDSVGKGISNGFKSIGKGIGSLFGGS